jgi:hypothetical protein
MPDEEIFDKVEYTKKHNGQTMDFSLNELSYEEALKRITQK